MNLREYLARQQETIDAELARLVPPESAAPQTIHRAMRYSLFAGGSASVPFFASKPRAHSATIPRV